MAYHNSTPDSVLDAPVAVAHYVVQHVGMPRAPRRHSENEDTGKHYNIPKQFQPLATNKPYVNSKKERSEKVLRRERSRIR